MVTFECHPQLLLAKRRDVVQHIPKGVIATCGCIPYIEEVLSKLGTLPKLSIRHPKMPIEITKNRVLVVRELNFLSTLHKLNSILEEGRDLGLQPRHP